MNANSQAVYLGVDLGGTKVDVGLVDSKGKILQRIKGPTDVAGGASSIIQGIVHASEQLQKDVLGSQKAICIGLGVPGQIDRSGNVKFAPNLQWHNVPLRGELTKALGLPVYIENDVRVATWGEWLLGEGKGAKDLICLFIGTGIGGGIVANGSILSGSTNSAGELGHMTIVLNGRKCHCGNLGCMEAYAGGWAIGEIAREEIKARPQDGIHIVQAAGGQIDSVAAKHVEKAFLEGDPLAKKLVNQAAAALIGGIVGLVNAFNPEKVVLGGGVINGLPMLIAQIEAGVKEFALKSATEKVKIAQALLREDAGVVGSAAMAARRIENGF